jgi:hypothetical protein
MSNPKPPKPPKPEPPAVSAAYRVDNLPTRVEFFAAAIAPALLANPGLRGQGVDNPQAFAVLVCQYAQALDTTIDDYQ